MGKGAIAGLLVFLVLFIVISVFLASKVTMYDGGAVTLPGVPSDAAPVSLLTVIWNGFLDIIGAGVRALFPISCSAGGA